MTKEQKIAPVPVEVLIEQANIRTNLIEMLTESALKFPDYAGMLTNKLSKAAIADSLASTNLLMLLSDDDLGLFIEATEGNADRIDIAKSNFSACASL